MTKEENSKKTVGELSATKLDPTKPVKPAKVPKVPKTPKTPKVPSSKNPNKVFLGYVEETPDKIQADKQIFFTTSDVNAKGKAKMFAYMKNGVVKKIKISFK